MERHQEDFFENQNGIRIYTQAWLPVEKPKACLLVAHGLGEHSGRYAHMANFFNEKGVALYALDHQGHGRSAGKRGHVPKFSNFIDDVLHLRNTIKEAWPETPVFLFGHSMGGLIALTCLLDDQQKFAAAIISAPAVRVKIDPPEWQKKLVAVLTKIMPGLTLNNTIDAAWLSHDQAVVDAYRNDPLVHPKISFALFTGMDAAGLRCLREAAKISLPTMLLVGGEDKIVRQDVVHSVYEHLASADKVEKVFPGAFHEVHNEVDFLQEFGLMWEWLEAKIAAPAFAQ